MYFCTRRRKQREKIRARDNPRFPAEPQPLFARRKRAATNKFARGEGGWGVVFFFSCCFSNGQQGVRWVGWLDAPFFREEEEEALFGKRDPSSPSLFLMGKRQMDRAAEREGEGEGHALAKEEEETFQGMM